MAGMAENGWILLEWLGMARMVRNCCNGWKFMDMAKLLIGDVRVCNVLNGCTGWKLVTHKSA